MRVAFYLNIISPHQLPLAREVARRVGIENFIYIYDEELHAERASMGWNDDACGLGFRVQSIKEKTSAGWLENADIVYTGLRCVDLMARRLTRKLNTQYYSERWFKPVPIIASSILLPGWIRLFVPHYYSMAQKFSKLFASPAFKYLPVGVWAEKDMKLLHRFFSCNGSFLPWGYFVEPSVASPESRDVGLHSPIRVLYIGRLLRLKCVDTIIRAVAQANAESGASAFELTIVGDGPDEPRLRRIAAKLADREHASPYNFLHSIPIAEVRSVMRENDVLVFASNAMDGWGAVVSEGLEEGMIVFGSTESGAGATMLPLSHQFHCRDWRRLGKLLIQVSEGELRPTGIGEWTASRAAEKLLA